MNKNRFSLWYIRCIANHALNRVRKFAHNKRIALRALPALRCKRNLPRKRVANGCEMEFRRQPEFGLRDLDPIVPGYFVVRSAISELRFERA
jgi:hypothetical protein